ncbi:hypothetical protein MOQ_005685 [Trypanosoma cruzi marinkellei]|uniref:MINDY4 N-terminal dimerisation domain-containing protein n=1 Tax=Trypanosoma cruzi marinkellei TaxID=85056 RepID=K2NNS9_TRYCR|nr:hypothetical protein MOQ_005685 [Trypanosoma cruzi marinkellei]
MSDENNNNRSPRGDEQIEGQADNSRRPKSGAVNMDAITSLTVREQVDALAQALLREFMHRRGYTKTLQKFDCECPRDERTIASRQLMRQLLEIPSHAFPSRLSGEGGTHNTAMSIAPGEREANDEEKKSKKKKKKVAPTYMEELCSYRLQKREVQQRRQHEEEKKGETEEGVETTTIIDPSDAEMEEWRAAAIEKERRIAETREHHEQLLRERRERKQRKKEKRKKKQEKREKKQKEGEGSRHHIHEEDEGDGGDTKINSHNSVLHRYGKRRSRLDDASDSDDDVLLRPISAKAVAAPQKSHRNGNGESVDEGIDGAAARGGLAEPEFLLSRMDKRREQRTTGHAVGSHWTPYGGNVTELIGSSRAALFGPDTPMPSPSATDSLSPSMNSERPPAFLLGEGMSLMSERMQAAKRMSALGECPLPLASPPPPAPSTSPLRKSASAIRGSGGSGSGSGGGGGGSRTMRGGAGFTSSPVANVWSRSSSREGSPGVAMPTFHYTTAGQHMLSLSSSGRAHSPPLSLDGSVSVTMPPPPPTSSILKTSSLYSSGNRGFDGKARPASSAMRKDDTNNTDKNGDGANGEKKGSEREQVSGRKNRKVTILVD